MKIKKSKLIYLFILIILVGAFFRFNYADLTRFGKEPVKDMTVGLDMVEGNLIAHGVLAGLDERKLQVTLGPTYYYVIAFSLLFTNNPYNLPLFPIYAIAILNILAAIVCYKFGKEFFNEFVGFVSASLFLLAPWNIVHVGTILTPPNLLPLAIISMLYFIFKVVIKKEDIYIIPAIASLALITQFHLVSILMSIPFLLTLLLLRRDINKKYFLLGVLAGLIVFSPFLIYSVTTDNFETINYLIGRDESSISSSIIESIGIPVMLTAPFFGKYMLGKGVSMFKNPIFDYYFLLITALICILFFMSLVYLSKGSMKEKNKKYFLLLIWLILPIIFLALPGKNVSPHYFIMLYPIQFIILAIFLNYLFKNYKTVGILLISIILISNIFFTYSFYRYLEESGGTAGLYESPYKFKMQVIEFIKKDSKETIPEVFFYKYKRINFIYLFELNDIKAKFGTVDSIDEFKKGYLILDRYSLYSPGEKEMSDEENKKVDRLDKINIKHFEIIKR